MTERDDDGDDNFACFCLVWTPSTSQSEVVERNSVLVEGPFSWEHWSNDSHTESGAEMTEVVFLGFGATSDESEDFLFSLRSGFAWLVVVSLPEATWTACCSVASVKLAPCSGIASSAFGAEEEVGEFRSWDEITSHNGTTILVSVEEGL